MTENSTPRMITINAPCRICDKMKSVEIRATAYDLWAFHGMYIQDAAPDLSVDDREFIISKICGPCFDALYPYDEGGEQ